ncbi:hypothetical protein [Streptomyces monashensis]|uniref:Uncharacterized protein n=1 Tax=Streptomyces monashensis TaxID=1678012 RepID=A0A1S2P9M1_9ACTN|nr:hypothetical protein [Streptomyces monashensis]OIJ90327.1 hypothetical protein BIV23_40885 [Streptomyces monashensis]
MAVQKRYGAETPVDVTTAADGPQQQAGDEFSWEDYFHSAWVAYTQEHGGQPSAAALAAYVYERDGITNAAGSPITGGDLEAFVARFRERTFGSASVNEEADGAVAGPADQGAGRAASSSVAESYARAWTDVKYGSGLSMTAPEKKRLAEMLNTCD